MAAALVAQKDFSQFGFVASAGTIIPAEVYEGWGSALTNRLQYGDVKWENTVETPDAPADEPPVGEPVPPVEGSGDTAPGELALTDAAPPKSKK